jgi:hypothetical protein
MIKKEIMIFGTRKSCQKTGRAKPFRGYGRRTRKQKLSGESGLQKKRDPAKRLGFFVKKRQSGNHEISSNTSLYPGRINAPLEFLKG